MASDFTPRDALRLLLRPLVRFCLKQNLFVHDFVEAGKQAFIDIALEELRKTTSKINASRVHVATGLDRRDVKRLFKGDTTPAAQDSVSITARVAARWESSALYRTKRGRPRQLTFEGPDSEFFELVRSISKSVNPATVLFEMIRIGAVGVTGELVSLKRHNPSVGENPEKMFSFISEELDLTIRAGLENATGAHINNAFYRTRYDNVYVKDVRKARLWFLQQSKAFHKRAREFLQKLDRDIHPRSGANDTQAGGTVQFTTISFTDPAE